MKLSGTTAYKGILLFAEVNGRTAGSWGALGEGLQLHPSCKHAVTHDVYHLSGHSEDEAPWVVPADYTTGDSVVFKATVVRSYSIWRGHTAPTPSMLIPVTLHGSFGGPLRTRVS